MINFPDSPTLNQVFQGPNGVSYTWNGTLWLVQNTFAGGTGDFCANQTSGFPALTGSYQTLIPPTVLTGNSGGWYSTSTGRYTPPAGRYSIDASISVTSTGISNISLAIRKNGVVVDDANQTTVASGWGNTSLSFILDANGTDWFDIQAVQSAGGTTIGTITFQAFPLTGMQGPMGPSGNLLINGAGAPTGLSAAKGTLYINTTATTTTTRLYINTDGATTWANFTASV